jgi:neutral ceramidase
MPSDFKIGAAKADITDQRAGLVLAGFAYEKQVTTGDIDVLLYARAFVIEENRASPRHLCLVVLDAWSAAEPLKSEVLKKLKPHFGNRYTAANLVLSATHSHAGPGGYSHHMLYNLTTGGHDTAVLRKMVDGIVRAVRDAEAAKTKGRIHVSQGDLANCGDNQAHRPRDDRPALHASQRFG